MIRSKDGFSGGFFGHSFFNFQTLASVLLALALALSGTQPVWAKTERALIKIQSGADVGEQEDALAARGYRVVRRIDARRWVVERDSSSSDQSLAVRLSGASSVSGYLAAAKLRHEYFETDLRHHIVAAIPAGAPPNDTLYTQQDGVRRMLVENAWKITTGDRSIKIGIVDTGYATKHFDLQGALVANAAQDAGGAIEDDNGHGTHVAGIIGADANNRNGVAGVAWNATIMPYKAFDSGGYGLVSEEISGLMNLADRGARVINASWGGPGYSQALADAIDYTYARGALVVAAAGNDGSNTDQTAFYPADFDHPGVLSVGSSSADGSFSNFSNYGATSVGVVAPGNNILSTFLNNGYQRMSGTSMAAPMVTGIAALILSVAPALEVNDLRNALLNAVNERSSYRNLVATRGDIDAGKAVTQLYQGYQIWPSAITIRAGHTFKFSAYDGAGRANTAVSWNAAPAVRSAGGGSISGDGTFTAQAVGDVVITAQNALGQIASTRRVSIINPNAPNSGTTNPGTPSGGGCSSPAGSGGSASNFGLPLFVGMLARLRRRRQSHSNRKSK